MSFLKDKLKKIIWDTRSHKSRMNPDAVSKIANNDIGSNDIMKRQINQIINYEDNTILGSKSLIAFFKNCIEVLKSDFKDREDFDIFRKSLDNSLILLENNFTEDYMEKVNNLQPNNDKSFLLIPVRSRNHLFSSIVYKKSNDNFEIVLINKDGGKKYPFQKYIVPKKNIKDICKLFAESSYANEIYNINIITLFTETTEQLYNIFQKKCINKQELKNIYARPQVVSNCYHKEVEEGFKYLCYKSYGTCEKRGNLEIPKFKNGTKKFHEQLFDNMMEELLRNSYHKFISKTLVSYVDHSKDIYLQNKKFRDFMKKISDDNYEEKKRKIFEEYYVTDFPAFKEQVMSIIDRRTFDEYIDFFVELLKENNIFIPERIINCKSNIFPGYVQAISIHDTIIDNDVETLEFFNQNFKEIGKNLIKFFYQKILFLEEYYTYKNLNKAIVNALLDGYGFELKWMLNQKEYQRKADITDLIKDADELTSLDKSKIIRNVKEYSRQNSQNKNDVDFMQEAKKGNIDGALSMYNQVLSSRKLTLEDIKNITILLKQTKKPLNEYRALTKKIETVLNKTKDTFFLTRFNFVNTFICLFFQNKLIDSLKKKYIAFNFWEAIGENKKALKKADEISTIYCKTGQLIHPAYLNIQAKKAELLRKERKERSSKEVLLELVKLGQIGKSRQLKRKLNTYSYKIINVSKIEDKPIISITKEENFSKEKGKSKLK